jgi:hypothetical protein
MIEENQEEGQAQEDRTENRVDPPIQPASSPDAPAGPTTGEQLEKEHGTAAFERPPQASPDIESPGLNPPTTASPIDVEGTEQQERPQEILDAEAEGEDGPSLDERLGNDPEDDEEK